MDKPVVTIVPSGQQLSETIQQESQMQESIGEVCFNLFNVGKIFSRLQKWRQLFPNIKPFYAVKSNNEPLLLKVLVKLGLGFDCASKGEVEMVMDLGASPDRIVFANTTKIPSHIKHAAQCGIDLMTIDDEQEVLKLHELFPAARLLIRLAVKDVDADTSIKKFGCSLSTASKLLNTAKKLGSNVVGVSFHIGRNNKSSDRYAKAIKFAHQVFTYARSCNFNFTILDIGGGFLSTDEQFPLLESIAATINSTIEELFVDFPNLEIMAEPGRFFSCPCFTLAASVYARRVTEDSSLKEGKRFTYYIADGHHGSFYYSCPSVKVLNKKEETHKYPCVILGPTCSPYDVVCSDVLLPELNNGDWIYFENNGAYTLVHYAEFNGFKMPKICYFIEKDKLPLLEELGITITAITRMY